MVYCMVVLLFQFFLSSPCSGTTYMSAVQRPQLWKDNFLCVKTTPRLARLCEVSSSSHCHRIVCLNEHSHGHWWLSFKFKSWKPSSITKLIFWCSLSIIVESSEKMKLSQMTHTTDIHSWHSSPFHAPPASLYRRVSHGLGWPANAILFLPFV